MSTKSTPLATLFETSRDYPKLWGLIHDGYRIPAWIFLSPSMEDAWRFLTPDMSQYSDDPDHVLVEVSNRSGNEGYYEIGYPGQCFGRGIDDVERFAESCEKLQLQFVEPTPQYELLRELGKLEGEAVFEFLTKHIKELPTGHFPDAVSGNVLF